MLDDATFERLSERVHIGWMQEKQRQGFADHVWVYDITLMGDPRAGDCFTFSEDGRRCRVSPDKHHADMLPYVDLAEHVKEYDRATVRAVLDAMDHEGITLVHPIPTKGS